jgi:hypothetical protein
VTDADRHDLKFNSTDRGESIGVASAGAALEFLSTCAKRVLQYNRGISGHRKAALNRSKMTRRRHRQLNRHIPVPRLRLAFR